MSQTFRKVQVPKLGKLEVVEAKRAPLGPNELRIAVQAAGINFGDALVIAGLYQEKPPLPFTPGGECAGVVVESNSSDFRVGDHVMAVTQLGSWAEEVVVSAKFVFRYPSTWSAAQAAAFPVTYGTAHIALLKARLQPGEVVLVTGASGGTGAAAVGIAKALGARVIATARGPTKTQFCKHLGADLVVDLSKDELTKAALTFTAGRGVDVVYETVGSPLLDMSLKCIKWGGRVLIIGFAGGKIPQVPANVLLVKNTDVLGVYWGAQLRRAPQVVAESFKELFHLMEEGKLALPLVNYEFPLMAATTAIQALKNHEVMGKAVLTISAEQSKL